MNRHTALSSRHVELHHEEIQSEEKVFALQKAEELACFQQVVYNTQVELIHFVCYDNSGKNTPSHQESCNHKAPCMNNNNSTHVGGKSGNHTAGSCQSYLSVPISVATSVGHL